MKNITKSIIALFAVLALSCSVEDVQDRPVIEGIDSPVLTAPTAGASYVLKPENAAAQAERFTWKSANYGGDVQVNYVIEMDKKGNEFKTSKELGSALPSENQVSVSVESMNGAALSLKATPFSPGEFEVRVKASAGTAVMYSNVIGIVITPYTTENPKLWIPGGYQSTSGYGTNWTHSTAPTLMAPGYGKTDFEGYVYVATAQVGTVDGEGFKLTSQADWAGTNYGAGAAGLLSTTGGNFSIAVGYYLIKADTDPTKLTYSATAMDWGLIGSATAAITGGDGWGNDANLTYDKVAKVWKITIDLTADKIKFRANDAWDVDLGDTGANGSLEYKGTDISVPTAGNYTVTLDLSSPRNYKYTLTKN